MDSDSSESKLRISVLDTALPQIRDLWFSFLCDACGVFIWSFGSDCDAVYLDESKELYLEQFYAGALNFCWYFAKKSQFDRQHHSFWARNQLRPNHRSLSDGCDGLCVIFIRAYRK
jgi:hypothetical protein